MKTRCWRFAVLAGCLLLAATLWPRPAHGAAAGKASSEKKPSTTILFIAGPCQHPPGTHEAAAGARLLKYCVENAEGVQPVRAEISYAWPKDDRLLDETATIVFTGDLFPPERMDEPAAIKGKLAALMDRGCGIVCVHYATGLRAQHVAEDGDHPLLRWLGGYFASGCPHHRSTARVCTATVIPEKGDHPVLRGWQTFTFDDEPYWNNYFGKEGLAPNVTPLASSMLPPEKPQRQIVAWAVERTDGGRGVGIVLPHFFRSWRVDDLRILVLNSIWWTARLDVPPEGVKCSLPELATFEPGSVDPKPRPKKKPRAAK